MARWVLVVILILFVVLGVAYALTTPTMEAPDEFLHYDYVRSLINTGSPPVSEEDGDRDFGHHAPLYYAAGALASFWVGEEDLAVWRSRPNPYFGYRFGDVGRDNKNIYLHPDGDSFGSSDTWLGIRVVRVVSVLMGAVVVWVIYRIGREVFPARPDVALGAAGLAAFIPEFLFISGAVNDDNAATLFGSLALWAMVRILGHGPNWRRCVGLGLALGLGWLSKLTMVALVPVAGVVVAWIVWRSRSWQALRWGVVVFVAAGLLIIPWIVRQLVLHGDPIGLSGERAGFGDPERLPTLANLMPDLYWLRTSFWGRLGANQIPLSGWMYVVLDIVTLIAVSGLVRLVVRHFLLRSPFSARTSQLALLTVAFVLTLGPMIVRRFLRPMPSFGRYLFPVLPAIVLILFVGLTAWLPRRRHSLLALGVTAAMLLFGIAGLVFFLAPAYARPAIYDAASAPEPANRLDWVYLENDRPLGRLRGYDLDKEEVESGGILRVRLHWEVLGETQSNYVLFAQLFGHSATTVGQRDTYPGLGHYPTSFWRTGQVIVDEVPIPVSPDAVGPTRLRLDVGLYQRDDGERLAVVDDAGDVVGAATIGWLKLAAMKEIPPPAVSTDYRFGDGWIEAQAPLGIPCASGARLHCLRAHGRP
jgi:hypothetical protein